MTEKSEKKNPNPFINMANQAKKTQDKQFQNMKNSPVNRGMKMNSLVKRSGRGR